MPPRPSLPNRFGIVSLLLAAALAACGPAPVIVATPVAAAPVEAAPDPDAGPIPVGARDATWGSPTALVTVVVFGDFSNPFCAFRAPWIRSLRTRYPPEELRIVWKSAPRGGSAESRRAAAAARAVFAAGGARAFWAFHDAAFAAHPDLSAEAYERWALAAGVPVAAFRLALASPETAQAIAVDRALGEELGLDAPDLLVNGVAVTNLDTIEALTSMIELQRAKARTAVEDGTPLARVVDQQTRYNLAHRNGRAPARTSLRAQVPSADARVKLGAKHLLVMYAGSRRAPPHVTRTRDEALLRAREALRKIRAGKPFEEAVAEYSDEPNAALRGGDLGIFPRGAMVPDFERALEQTPVGQLSEVAETPFGFHVILRTR